MTRSAVLRLLRGAALAMLAATWLAAGPARAHKPSDSYLTLEADGERIGARWDIALRDLDHAIGLDADGNGEITWGELRARHAEIAAYALARLKLEADGQACRLELQRHLVDAHSDGAYAVMMLDGSCPLAPRSLAVGYTLFADLDPQHRGLLGLTAQGETRSAVLDPQAGPVAFDLGQRGRWAQFADYLREGVWHIWIGFDHILFLLSLLLPAVLVWRDRGWSPAPSARAAFWDVFKIVTAFTAAHSITLSLATLGVVTLPSRGVESAIAASVVLAALNNVWPLFRGRRWIVAFGFGLVHGFGFASVLADLGLPQQALLLALVGFNLGVELGQLAIVGLLLPPAFALRATAFYRRGVLVFGSLAIAALAALWFVERAFGLRLVGL